MTNRRQWRQYKRLAEQYKRLAEQGRRLATAREDLIAAGADPDELLVPLYPVPPLGPDGKHGTRHTPTFGCQDVPPHGGTQS